MRLGTRTLAATLALSAWLCAGAAFAAPHPMYLPGQGPARARVTGSELYYGGPVLSAVKVIAVMWGKQVDAGVQAQIGGFYASATNSTWFDIMTQYATNLVGVNGHQGTNQTIGRGTFQSLAVIKPKNTSKTLTDKDVRKELDKQITSGALPKADANTLYMIYFPQGVTITLGSLRSCVSYGAYHEGFTSKKNGSVFYGIMPACGYSFDEYTYVSSHELAEAVSDAFPTPGTHPDYPQAWNTSGGSEIADLCEGSEGTIVGKKKSYTVTEIYTNVKAGCSTGNFTSP